MNLWLALLVVLGMGALTACAPTAAPAPGDAVLEEPPVHAAPSRPLVISVRVEPVSITTRVLGQPGVALGVPRGLFNAQLALIDGHGNTRPYLAEALPQLHTDSWRVYPDGRMDTTYRLKANIVWHDGTPLSVEDFIFAWRVYVAPEHGFSTAPPFHAVAEVLAVDHRTVAIRWNQPYPGAGSLSATNDEFPPLPSHLLAPLFEQLPPDGFSSHPYWTREHVGLGPYRLDRWEPGAFFEAAAFDRYVLGRPKIERIKVVFISDPNTTLANLLAGEVHLATDNSLGLQQMGVLRGEWSKAGTPLVALGTSWRLTFFQLRPELARPLSILDIRVRRALAHAVDRQALNDTVYAGNFILADSMMWTGSEFGPAADRAVVKYAYEPRRSEQLMNEASYRRGSDGVYANAAEERFTAGVKTTAGADFETEMTIMASEWRRLGFDVQESVIPAAQAQDAQLSATFPAMLTRTTFLGQTSLVAFTAAGIPGPETRWRGTNRGGWSHPEYDRLVEAFKTTLDKGERAQQVAQLTRIFTEELPVISLFFLAQPIPYVSNLRGPHLVPPEANRLWNIHEWEFR